MHAADLAKIICFFVFLPVYRLALTKLELAVHLEKKLLSFNSNSQFEHNSNM